MRSRASVPIAENMSAYLAICSELFVAWACAMFRYLQKYGFLSSGFRFNPHAYRNFCTPHSHNCCYYLTVYYNPPPS